MRERLLGDIIAEAPSGVLKWTRNAEHEVDAIRDVEVRFLARLLHDSHEIPCASLLLEFLGDLQIENDDRIVRGECLASDALSGFEQEYMSIRA